MFCLSRLNASSHLRFCAAISLLCLSAWAIVFAFPQTHFLLRTPITNGVLLTFIVVLIATTIRALWLKRWISALFHLGASLVIVGGGITAGYAKEGHVTLIDALDAPIEYRQFMLDDERVALHSFEIATYPDGMPQQYTSRLVFVDGVREVSVNAPLRHKGWTYYQMSYQKVFDPYGNPVLSTLLTVRKDPGVPFTFSGYAILVLAAFLLALRESFMRKQQVKEAIA